MSLAPVVNPYEPFVGLTGTGLNNGHLYIGVDGMDPQANPQDCFWDAGGTILAAQPIDIVGGYPMRLGTPAQVFTASTYSMRLRDRLGVQVFYLASAGAASGVAAGGAYSTMAAAQAANIAATLQTTGFNILGYYAAGDGGGAQYRYAPVQAAGAGKFQSADGAWWEIASAPLNVRQFGAKGDGATDDTAAIASALSTASSLSRALFVNTTPSYFKITDQLTVPGGIELRGYGAESRIKQTVGEKNALFVGGDDVAIIDIKIEGDGSATAPVDFSKSNGIYASGRRNLRVQGCHVREFRSCGVQLRNCYNVQIVANLFHENKYSYPAGIGSCSDILLYSGAGGGRSTIANNLCLSNNSQGIFVGALGFDSDIAITGNVCAALDAAWGEVASASLNRRHGIQVGYGSGAGTQGRYTVTGNVCRNSLITGIYCAGNSAGFDAVSIVGNVCSKNGYVTGADASLAGGIFVNAGATVTLIEGNSVYDFKGLVASNVGLIVFNAGAGLSTCAHIIGNVCQDSTAHGIVVKGVSSVESSIANNRVSGCAGRDINYEVTAGSTAGVVIAGNRCKRSNTNYASVYLEANGAAAERAIVRDNHVTGFDYTVNTTDNTAIFISRASPFAVFDNHVVNFRYGVYGSSTIAGRQLGKYQVDRNHFDTCDTAILLKGADATALVVLDGNMFESVTTQAGAGGFFECGFHGRRMGDRIVLSGMLAAASGSGYVNMNATPRAVQGVYIVGDWIENAAPAAGGTPGWVCTTAGAVGVAVWKAMANIAA